MSNLSFVVCLILHDFLNAILWNHVLVVSEIIIIIIIIIKKSIFNRMSINSIYCNKLTSNQIDIIILTLSEEGRMLSLCIVM